jgi:hypothetical protein
MSADRRKLSAAAGAATLVPAAQQRAEAMAEVWAHLRTSDQRPLTRDEHARLRSAEARVNRRFG